VLAAAAAPQLAALAFGCTSTITPPPNPEHPTTVFLLREAMHAGLVMPREGGAGYVEFGFGDWSWFALGNDSWYHVFATVLWLTAGTLGRRTFTARDEAELRARASWADLSPVAVDGDRMRELRNNLQQQFDAAAANAVSRPELGWTFVPMDRSYWFANNCADVTAEWFEALGCHVGWALIRTSLAVGR
jgi:hypothetical protein